MPIRKGYSSRGALLDRRVHDILRNEGSRRSGAQGHHDARGRDDVNPEAHLSSACRAGRGHRIFRRAPTKTGKKRTDCRIESGFVRIHKFSSGRPLVEVVQPGRRPPSTCGGATALPGVGARAHDRDHRRRDRTGRAMDGVGKWCGRYARHERG